MSEQIFSDGVASVTVINGTVRLEFFSFAPAGKEDKGQPRPVPQHRLVLPLPGFLQMAAQIQETVQAVAKRVPFTRSAGPHGRVAGCAFRPGGKAGTSPGAAEEGRQAVLSVVTHPMTELASANNDQAGDRASPLNEDGPASEGQTGLKGLVAVARYHGLDWSLQRIVHVHGQGGEPDAEQLARTARTEGLTALVHRIDWDRLQRFRKLTPFLARLDHGGYVVILQTGVEPPSGTTLGAGPHVLMFNPRTPEANVFPVAREDFLRHWSGEVILLKRAYKLSDTDRRFGLGWFVPEFWRQRGLLRNVVYAALAMHVLALAVPVFFQIVIDRVLVYLNVSTLVVITIGVIIAIMFNAMLSWLRGYFVLRTASRIDIRLAGATFRHLMGLPISFLNPRWLALLPSTCSRGRRFANS